MPLADPSIFLANQMPHHGVRVEITNPSSTPETSHNLVRRRPQNQATWKLLGMTEPNENYVDYTAANGIIYEYQVTAVGTDDSEATSQILTRIVEFDDWMVKDLNAISDSMYVDIANDNLEWSSEEVQAGFNVIGGTTKLVIKDENIKGAEWAPIFEFLSKAEADKFDALRHKQKTLLLQAPFLGLQWFFQFDTDGRWTVLNPHTPWLRFTCGIIEVGEA